MSTHWQRIEHAPRDGTLILVANLGETDGRVWQVSEAVFAQVGFYDRAGKGCHWATHWCPMPTRETDDLPRPAGW